MKRHPRLWDALATEIEHKRDKRRIRNIRKAFSELSKAYSVPWWKRILNRIKGV